MEDDLYDYPDRPEGWEDMSEEEVCGFTPGDQD